VSVQQIEAGRTLHRYVTPGNSAGRRIRYGLGRIKSTHSFVGSGGDGPVTGPQEY
jgi:hypothetical protein